MLRSVKNSEGFFQRADARKVRSPGESQQRTLTWPVAAISPDEFKQESKINERDGLDDLVACSNFGARNFPIAIRVVPGQKFGDFCVRDGLVDSERFLRRNGAVRVGIVLGEDFRR